MTIFWIVAFCKKNAQRKVIAVNLPKMRLSRTNPQKSIWKIDAPMKTGLVIVVAVPKEFRGRPLPGSSKLRLAVYPLYPVRHCQLPQLFVFVSDFEDARSQGCGEVRF
jgi:hypothetical protein